MMDSSGFAGEKQDNEMRPKKAIAKVQTGEV